MAKSNEDRLFALETMLAHLQEQVSNLQDQIWEMKSSSSSSSSSQPSPTSPPGVDPEVISHLRAGNLINAIKRVREITGMGLAEAKREAERIRDEMQRHG
jgi:ribosomal protein L7/L12